MVRARLEPRDRARASPPLTSRVRRRVPAVHSIARRARSRLDRESKVSKQAHQLEYLVYGKFKFDGRDTKGVFRFGTEWVPIEEIAQQRGWDEKEAEFQRRVRKLRAPFVSAQDDEPASSSSSSEDDDDDDDD